MARRSVLLLVAALIALAGTAMIVLYVQGIDARATKDQELVEVLVATATIDLGESVADAQDAGKIDKAEVRRADLVDGSLTSTTSIADDVAIGTIYPGEQLIAKKFGTLGDTQSLVIPDGKMAVSVELTDFERVAGFVNPGNEIAVFATALDPMAILADNKEQKLGSVTRIVLTRVPVLGVGTTSVTSRTVQAEDGATATEEVARTILTIAVTQEEAERFIQADRTSELNFALLTDDSKVEDGPGAKLGDVFPELYPGPAVVTAVLEPDVGQRGILQAMLHGSAAFADLEGLDQHIRNTHNEFAVVIGPSVPSEAAAELAQWARVHRPDLGVILLRHDVDSAALSLALRSGMREVVAARDLAGITTAVQRARSVANAIGQTLMDEAQAVAVSARAEAAAEIAEAAAVAQAQADAPRGKIVTVFSTKGGVGKSLVATNVGVALARAGSSVCLVDLDVNSGDVAIMLQLTPQRTINDLVGFDGVIDAEGIASILTHHSDNLSIVAAPVRIDSPDQASQDDVAKLLDALRRMVDFVVVDTSGTFDDLALCALDRSDCIVLVGTLDIPSLKALKLATSTLEVLNFPKSTWRFVLNRADGKVGLTVEEYEKTLGLKADSSLVSSREVLAAVNRGEALVSAYPNHPNSKALVTFSKNVADSIAEPAAATESTPSSRKSSGSRLRLRRA